MKKIAFLFLLMSSCALQANNDELIKEEVKKLLAQYSWYAHIQSCDLAELSRLYRSPADLQRRIIADVKRDATMSEVSARLLDAGEALASSVPLLWPAEERKSGVTFQRSEDSPNQEERKQLVAIKALPKKAGKLEVGPFMQSKL
jgi:hypothetical protein